MDFWLFFISLCLAAVAGVFFFWAIEMFNDDEFGAGLLLIILAIAGITFGAFSLDDGVNGNEKINEDTTQTLIHQGMPEPEEPHVIVIHDTVYINEYENMFNY